MARISLAEAAQGTEGVLLRGDPEATVVSYSIDTRTLKAGDLFFALVGPNHDAHGFVPEAIRKGASAVVISRGRAADFPGAAAVIRVPDTTRALQDLGRWVRRRQPVKVVGITGSAGKTTTKEMTAAALEEAMPTLKSTGNLNNTFGLPLCLLELEPRHQAAVLEMGMSYAGELTRLAAIADPDVGVLTNVYPAHLEHFPSLAAIADAKGELFRGMREDAVAVYNADDPEATRVALPFPGRKIGFGFSDRAEVRATDLDSLPSGSTRFRLHGAGGDVDLEIPFPGRHHVANAVAAAAAARAAGADPAAIRRGLARTRPLPMRGALLRMKGDVRVLDETYNSNPRAMERTLETLAGIPAARKVVAAGDMRELGPSEKEAHRTMGEQVARSGAALFVAVGPLSALAAESARGSGLREVRHFPDSVAAAAWTAAALRPGDLVLVKGSRGMAMERIVEAIRSSLGMEEA
jgi:UDP-N-acetylmuramoyl-tripeptide--D-alanyl-D-alanine ligase